LFAFASGRILAWLPIVTDELSCVANEMSAIACYEARGIPTYSAYVVNAKRI
jgi:hypothetical protein